MPRPSASRPFAVDSSELEEVERFCRENKLDVIGRICAELRVLRAEYLVLAQRAGKQKALVETLEHDPSKRFAKELDIITDGNDNAPTIT
jgi:hypothetical protein